MTLAELDVMLAAHPEATAILLTSTDWYVVMNDPAALPHRDDHPTEAGYIYRGLRVFVVSPGPSRLSRRDG